MATDKTKQLPKGPYDPIKSEEEILKFWLDNGFYKPEYDPQTDKQLTKEELLSREEDTFCIIDPPPNAYDRPHIGNVSGYAYQDVFGRYHRMLGKRVLLQPGKDHAGQEGEAVFIKTALRPNGKKKSDFSRAEFYKACYKYFQKNMKVAQQDEQRIGLSADFDRDIFTLDPRVVSTVMDTFMRMYRDDMLYKGVRIINWSPGMQSAISDNDTARMNREVDLTYIKYPLLDESDEIIPGKFIEVATTRPETMLGDTAVVVDPSDERYQDLIGTYALLPLVDRKIPIIANGKVDKEFGTGAVKMTPAHAAEDYYMSLEWNALAEQLQAKPEKGQVLTEALGYIGEQDIPRWQQIRKQVGEIGYINVIWKDSTMVGPIGEYRGMKVEEAQAQVVADLKELDLITKTEKIEQNVTICDRTKTIVEPIMSSQWFIDVDQKDFRQRAITAIERGVSDPDDDNAVRIHPENMAGKALHWLNNLRDWPISRSIWWGYRMPVWYKGQIEEHVTADGQIAQTIGGVEFSDLNDAAEKGLVKVQLVDPNENKLYLVPGKHGYMNRKVFKDLQQSFPIANTVSVGNIDSPSYRDYEKAFERMSLDEHSIIVTHSLSGPAMLEYLVSNSISVAALIILAPSTLQSKELDKYIQLGYWKSKDQYQQIHKLVGRVVLVHSDDDEHSDLDAYQEFAEVVGIEERYLEKEHRHYAGPVYDHHSEQVQELLTELMQDKDMWIQEPDCLDTWFSSGQWPFATLEADQLMDKFYPTSVMETAYDILEVWVCRMIMFGLYRNDRVPFRDVYLHGLIKAEDGQKMSKSKGNTLSIDDIIKDYGADTLRLFYIVGNKAGAAYRVDWEKIEGNRRFLNKLWNASKFVLMNAPEEYVDQEPIVTADSNKKLLAHIREARKNYHRLMQDFHIGIAAQNLVNDFWHIFCDECIEESKQHIYVQKDKETGEALNELNPEVEIETRQLLVYALRTYLKMLHPFVPFITDLIWQTVRDESESEQQGEPRSLMHVLWTTDD